MKVVVTGGAGFLGLRLAGCIFGSGGGRERSGVDGLLGLHDVDGRALRGDRSVNLPTLTVSVAEMIASMQRVARDRKLGAVREAPDPFVMSVVSGWPTQMQATRATALGLPKDDGLDGIVRDYIADYLA